MADFGGGGRWRFVGVSGAGGGAGPVIPVALEVMFTGLQINQWWPLSTEVLVLVAAESGLVPKFSGDEQR